MDSPTRKQKPNWVLYDPSAYWADTAHLDAADHGIYKLLIDLYYITGKPLEGTPRELLRQCRLAVTRRNERKLKVILQSFFIQMDAKWTQSRCDFELAARANLIEKKRKAAQKRWGSDADASDVNMQMHDAHDMPSTYTNTYTKKKEEEATGPESGPAHSPTKKMEAWDKAAAFLTQAGLTDERARNMLARWRLDYSDLAVLNALTAARTAAASEPIPYIQKILTEGKAKQSRASDYLRNLAQRDDESEQQH